MCGIVAVKRLDNRAAAKQVLKRYSKQKSRGTDGFGYVAVREDKSISVKRFQFEHEAKAKLDTVGERTILFHHRYPTSTPNVPEAAHPIKVAHKELAHNYYVLHNGVITNDDTLKAAHEKLGYKYTTVMTNTISTAKGVVYELDTVFNDSEALAVELARAIEGKTKKVLAEGAAAFIVLQTTKEGKALAMYYGTNGGNPLTIQTQKDFVAIASQGGTALQDNVVYRYDMATNEISLVSHFELTPYWTHKPERSVGFVGHGAALDYKGGHSSSEHYNRYKFNPTSYDNMSVGELESELEMLDDEIIGASADREYSANAGEVDRADDFLDDYCRLIDERQKVWQLLERKTVTRESATRD